MRTVPDWAPQACWWVSGIFATGAVWYFLSRGAYPAAIASSISALLFAAAAVWLHRRKDALFRAEANRREAEKPFVLSSSPTKANIERVILESDATVDWNKHNDMAKSVFSYARDMNLRFEMLNDGRGVQCADFREPWANKFPDGSATGYWCDLYYGSTQIARYVLVAVDGARAMLPIPKKGAPGERPTQVLLLEYKVAQIHDTLGNLDDYMRRAGLTVSRDG